jgi:hypothetical protein
MKMKKMGNLTGILCRYNTMRQNLPAIFLCIIVFGIFSACTTVPERSPVSGQPAASAASVPERPEPLPQVPELISGKGSVPQEKLAAFLGTINPRAEKKFAEELALFYIEEAETEGINHDVAFAQMCLETGFLNYGNLVTPDMNNFCGLGSTGPGNPGLSFPDPRTGVRAHIQHLKAYAADTPLNGELIDPRFRYVKRGSAPGIHELAGKWAADRQYGEKIAALLERLYTDSF